MKTYISILYFSTGLFERINVGLIMSNGIHCIVEIKQSKMDFVKHFKPEAFELFEHSVNLFKEHYSKLPPAIKQIKKHSNYDNGVFKVEEPNFIAFEFTQENFNKFFEKHI